MQIFSFSHKRNLAEVKWNLAVICWKATYHNSLWYMQQTYGTRLRLNWSTQVHITHSLFSALKEENVKIKSSVLISWQMCSIVVQSMHSCITTLPYLEINLFHSCWGSTIVSFHKNERPELNCWSYDSELLFITHTSHKACVDSTAVILFHSEITPVLVHRY